MSRPGTRNRARPGQLFQFLTAAEKWTGGKALAIREPGCPECGTPLIAASVEQPALFCHGGYGATRKTTWAICPNTECRWSVEHVIEEIRPDRGPKAKREPVDG